MVRVTRREFQGVKRTLVSIFSIAVSGFVLITKILSSLFSVNPVLVAILISFGLTLFAALSFYAVKKLI